MAPGDAKTRRAAHPDPALSDRCGLARRRPSAKPHRRGRGSGRCLSPVARFLSPDAWPARSTNAERRPSSTRKKHRYARSKWLIERFPSGSCATTSPPCCVQRSPARPSPSPCAAVPSRASSRRALPASPEGTSIGQHFAASLPSQGAEVQTSGAATRQGGRLTRRQAEGPLPHRNRTTGARGPTDHWFAHKAPAPRAGGRRSAAGMSPDRRRLGACSVRSATRPPAHPSAVTAIRGGAFEHFDTALAAGVNFVRT